MEVGGKTLEVPAWTAADWLRVLMDTTLLSAEYVILEMVPDGVKIILDEGISSEDLVDLSLEILDLAGGRPWYITIRLVGVLMDNWNVLGADLLKEGVDPGRLSLSGFLDVLLLQTLRNMEENQTSMFVAQLEMPPPGMEIPEEEMEMTREQFLSLAS